MDLPNDIAELTKLFQKLGAQDSELWARSQIKEGIPQLQRYLFLRQAWKQILREDSAVWIDRQIQESERYPTGPYAGVGAALKRAVATGTLKQGIRPTWQRGQQPSPAHAKRRISRVLSWHAIP